MKTFFSLRYFFCDLNWSPFHGINEWRIYTIMQKKIWTERVRMLKRIERKSIKKEEEEEKTESWSREGRTGGERWMYVIEPHKTHMTLILCMWFFVSFPLPQSTILHTHSQQLINFYGTKESICNTVSSVFIRNRETFCRIVRTLCVFHGLSRHPNENLFNRWIACKRP